MVTSSTSIWSSTNRMISVPVGIHLDLPQGRAGHPGKFDIFTNEPPQHLEHGLGGFVQVDHLGQGHLLADKGQQLAGQFCRSFGGFENLLQVGVKGMVLVMFSVCCIKLTPSSQAETIMSQCGQNIFGGARYVMTQVNLEDLDPAAKEQLWKEHIDQHRQSELTRSEYCRQNGMKLHQFIYWKK